MKENPVAHSRKHIFVGSDSQSCLMAMNPLKRLKFGHVDSSVALEKIYSLACEYDSLVHLQWVPSHVGLEPNEEADTVANDYRQIFSLDDAGQQRKSIHHATFKSILKQKELKRFHDLVLWDSKHTGQRFQVCGTRRSNFRNRASLPRSLQTLYARWRLGQVESCGTYPRKLKWIERPECRFCGDPCETVFHLLTTCPGTAPARISLGISLHTLCYDSGHNILAIAYFDAFIRDVLPYDSAPPFQQILSSTLYDKDGNSKRSALEVCCSVSNPSLKRRRTGQKSQFVIPLSPSSSPPLQEHATR